MSSESLAEKHVREFIRSALRSGLLDEQVLHDEVLLAITSELSFVEEPESLARSWIAEFRGELRADAAGWPDVTDYDRLQAAFTELELTGVAVLQGCEDHWAAKAVLDDRGPDLRGIAWFTQPDVWHAIDEGMLEVNVWHSTTANIAPGDRLLDEVVGIFAGQGLPAHFDEGRIEVTAFWQRRPEAAS